MYVKCYNPTKTAPTWSGGDFYPPADNIYLCGSADYSWKEGHFETLVYATAVVGNWSPSAPSLYSLGLITAEWQGAYLGDDTGVFIGLDQDSVIYHRTAVLNADTNLTGVLVGASQDTTALAANSLIISNITTDGDILIACSDGGHSKQMLFLDGSTGITHIGRPAAATLITETGDVNIGGAMEVTGALYVQGATTFYGSATHRDATLFGWGSARDTTVYHQAAGLGANTTLANVLNGTPVTPAIAVNSTIFSHRTSNGDILMAGNRGGNSEAFLFWDGSEGALYLYAQGSERIHMDGTGMGFFGATPVDQPDTIADSSGCTGDADDKVNLIIDRLQELGLIAT